MGGRPAGRAAGEFENKANSVQFQLKLPVGTELGNKLKPFLGNENSDNINRHKYNWSIFNQNKSIINHYDPCIMLRYVK